MPASDAAARLVRIVKKRRGTGHVENVKNKDDVVWSLRAARGQNAFETLEPYLEEIIDQGAANSCVGCMTRNLVSITESIAGRTFDPISHRAVYKLARAKDGIKGDIGSRISTAMRVAQKHGAPKEKDVPYSDVFIDAAIPLIKLVNGWNSSGFRYEHIFKSGEDKLKEIDAALRAGYPVGLGALVDRRFMESTGTKVYFDPGEAADWIGGHAMVLVAPRNKDGVYRLLSSWSKGWGDNGLINADQEYISKRAQDITIAYGWKRANLEVSV
jgi:hypothetical protein